MGNSVTKPISPETEQDETDKFPNGGIPRSVSSSSLSSGSDMVKEEDDESEKDETTCAMPSAPSSCIPPVLAFYRKEALLLLRPHSGGDSEVHEERLNDDDEGCETLSRGRSPLKVLQQTCSTGLRQRSWSPKSNKRLGFFSQYSKHALTASSTSSITSLISKTKKQLLSTGYTEEELNMVDGHLPTAESDLNRLRDYFIITTASLPWFTGTAVNPLLRAASLSRYQRQQFTPDRSTVTLVIPWLEDKKDRQQVYGDGWTDKTQTDQEAFIRDWLAQANMAEEALPAAEGGIRILFYPARYHTKMSSIFAMGDLCDFVVTQNNLTIPEDAVCVLEEPEHLHFYRDTNIRDHFSFVVGVVHTNYKAYASSAIPGGSLITGPLIASISSWLVRAYCDKVIKLSAVLQSFDCPEKEIVCNTHGIRYDFIREGDRRANAAGESGSKIYFVGKLLWQKGLDKMLELEAFYRNTTGEYFPIDIYGSGPDRESIEQAFKNAGSLLGSSLSFGSNNALEELPSSDENTSAETQEPESTSVTNNNRRGLSYVSTLIRPKPPVPANFMGREDHAELTAAYKIFVNPSITEVLCTTTAEATAMGKWVIIPDHPSNTFFKHFPNVLLYKSKSDFVDFLQYAISHEPEPLREELMHQLTWEAATERFIKAAAITRRDEKWRERRGKPKSDEKLARLHSQLGKGAKGDVIRKVLGGGPVADQNQYERERTQADDPLSEEEYVGADIGLPLTTESD